MSADQGRIDKILAGKEALRLIRADKNHTESMLDYVGALEQQLRFAATALERAKDLVGAKVTLDRPVSGYSQNTVKQFAHDWFDERIAAARELVDAKPPAPTGDL